MALTGLPDPGSLIIPVTAAQGGTGITSYAVGDLIYASAATTLSKLADVATGSALVSGGVGVAPLWSTTMTLLGTVGAKPAATAGIQLDPNAATGNFTLSLSPATLTAARRWSFPDRSDTVAGLAAQTFTGAQNISAATAAVSSITGSLTIGTGVAATNVGMGAGEIIAGASVTAGVALAVRANGTPLVIIDNLGAASSGGGFTLKTGGVNDWEIGEFGGTAGSRDFYFYNSTQSLFVMRTTAAAAATSVTTFGATTASTSTSTGGVVMSCGVGVAGSLYALTLNATQGTITAAAPTINSTVTWNAGGVTFAGWKLNVTSTASASASLLMDLQLGGVSQFSVRKDSLVTMAGLAYAGAANGELWHDTTQKCMQNFAGGIKRSVAGLIYSAHEPTTGVGIAASGTTSETSILPTSNSYGTLTLPANFFVQSKAVRITVRGRISDPGSVQTLRLKCKIGSSLNFDTTAFAVSTGGDSYFTFVVDLFCSAAGASGAVSGFGQFSWNVTNSNVKGHYWGQNLAVTTDTTISNALSVTAQISASGPIIFLLGFAVTVEALN